MAFVVTRHADGATSDVLGATRTLEYAREVARADEARRWPGSGDVHVWRGPFKDSEARGANVWSTYSAENACMESYTIHEFEIPEGP